MNYETKISSIALIHMSRYGESVQVAQRRVRKKGDNILRAREEDT
jgi:hypothetical protein